MKKLILTYFFFTGVFFLKSQNKVGYYYDNNGNRYQRYFIGVRPAHQDSISPADSVLNTPPIQSNELPKDPEALAAEYGVRVYPNPTRDVISVSMTKAGEKEYKNVDMFLIDNGGKTMDTKKYSGTEIRFDLSKNAPGNYYLKIVFDNREKITYNVIKIN